jgi:LysM repeat protein
VVYVVQRGDTLSSLARQTGITTAALMQVNCLSTSAIYAGQRLYLPSHPSPTLPYRCGPPLDWIIYYVQPGETLFSLARYFGISVEEIRLANCLTGYTIYVGQPLYLPPLPPMPVPTFTPTSTLMPTAAPAPTAPPAPPPTDTPVPPTPTFTPLPTATHTPTLTVSPPTDTPVPPTDTLTPTS